MLTISRDKKIGIMDKSCPPALYCDDGETVRFLTEDCSDAAVARDGTRDHTPGKYISNPATGPLYVRGSHPGDILKVEILSVKTADWGFMGTGFDEACFAGIKGEYKIRTFDLTKGYTELSGQQIPLRPMIGVIGVAPEGDGIGTLTPAFHGGNLDCTLIREGATVYFPVFTDGALLSMGDLHAVMGDGEVFQYGLEAAGEVVVRVSVIKNRTIHMPLVLLDGKLSALGSAKTLDECAALSVQQMYDLLLDSGWDKTEAGYLMSLQCDVAVCQTVDPNQTMRASLPAKYLQWNI